jgi:carbamate kinase
MRIVAALGGNALIRRHEAGDVETQRRNVEIAAAALAPLAAEHELIVTHGNGPQIGLLAMRAANGSGPPVPLDILGAESEGLIGYMVAQGLENVLPEREIATLLTQVVVDPDDPAFNRPTKPIGPVYDSREAAFRMAKDHHWDIAADGDVWRRVVPSPEPQRIVELATIELLVRAQVIVVCVGGGGVPVVVDESGRIQGVEAVIDKDLAASLLARQLDADALLLLTDVEGVESDFGAPGSAVISSARPDELRALKLAAGSMGPKVEAACRFAEATGGRAVIAQLDAAGEALAGRAGTAVAP